MRSMLSGLTDEQLHQLEGMERSNVEARIALLRNIQKLLDTAVLQMNQYTTLMSSLKFVNFLPFCINLGKMPCS